MKVEVKVESQQTLSISMCNEQEKNNVMYVIEKCENQSEMSVKKVIEVFVNWL